MGWDNSDREQRYRELYWKLNELQLIGGLEDTDEYKEIVWEMDNLEAWLGYVPAC